MHDGAPLTRVRLSLVAVAAGLSAAAGPTTQPVASTPPTVDQRIDQLLAPPPPTTAPVAKPTRRTAIAGPAKPQMLREGTDLVDVPGRLGHSADGRAAVFTFAPDVGQARPAYAPMIVLPNLELDAMERQQAGTGRPMVFRVSGQVTEYKGRNYLLVTESTDGSAADTGGRATPLSTEHPVDRTSGRAAVAPGAPTLPLAREGQSVFDRTGRLNRSADGNTDTFTFDTDAKTLRDPPMILLPNLKLAAMEGQQSGQAKDVKFRVSGTVTEYHGRNYLLLSKMVTVQDFDAEF